MTTSDKVVDFPDVSRAEEEAAQWVVALEDSKSNDDLRQRFREWLRTSEANSQAFRKMADLWGAFDQLEELLELTPERSTNSRTILNSNWRSALAIAACFLIVVCGVWIGTGLRAGETVYEAQFATALGEQRVAELPDSTVVTINTSSSLLVRFDREGRGVYLEHGEAFFQVAKDFDRPFTVLTRAGTVQAIGTAFSVRITDEAINVTVEEGRVQLKPAQVEVSALAEPLRIGSAGTVAEVSAGHNVTLDDKLEVVAIPVAQVERTLSWRDGVLRFEGDTLSHVVSEMARYTNVEIEIMDDVLSNHPVTGYFGVGEVEALLEALELMGEIEIERVDTERVRLNRREL